VGIEPALNVGYNRVTVIGGRLEHHVGRESRLVPLQGKELGGGLHRGRRDIAANQVQDQVVPRDGGAGGHEFLVATCGNQDPLWINGNLHKGSLKRPRIAPMNGCLLPIEKPCFRQQEDPGAGRAHQGALIVHLA
jgi:hypothetical protein